MKSSEDLPKEWERVVDFARDVDRCKRAKCKALRLFALATTHYALGLEDDARRALADAVDLIHPTPCYGDRAAVREVCQEVLELWVEALNEKFEKPEWSSTHSQQENSSQAILPTTAELWRCAGITNFPSLLRYGNIPLYVRQEQTAAKSGRIRIGLKTVPKWARWSARWGVARHAAYLRAALFLDDFMCAFRPKTSEECDERLRLAVCCAEERYGSEFKGNKELEVFCGDLFCGTPETWDTVPLAEAAYRRMLAEDPTHPGALYGFGRLLVMRRRVDEGLVHLENSLKVTSARPQGDVGGGHEVPALLDFLSIHFCLNEDFDVESKLVEARLRAVNDPYRIVLVVAHAQYKALKADYWGALRLLQEASELQRRFGLVREKFDVFPNKWWARFLTSDAEVDDPGEWRKLSGYESHEYQVTACECGIPMISWRDHHGADCLATLSDFPWRKTIVEYQAEFLAEQGRTVYGRYLASLDHAAALLPGVSRFLTAAALLSALFALIMLACAFMFFDGSSFDCVGDSNLPMGCREKCELQYTSGDFSFTNANDVNAVLRYPRMWVFYLGAMLLCALPLVVRLWRLPMKYLILRRMAKLAARMEEAASPLGEPKDEKLVEAAEELILAARRFSVAAGVRYFSHFWDFTMCVAGLLATPWIFGENVFLFASRVLVYLAGDSSSAITEIFPGSVNCTIPAKPKPHLVVCPMRLNTFNALAVSVLWAEFVVLACVLALKLLVDSLRLISALSWRDEWKRVVVPVSRWSDNVRKFSRDVCSAFAFKMAVEMLLMTAGRFDVGTGGIRAECRAVLERMLNVTPTMPDVVVEMVSQRAQHRIRTCDKLPCAVCLTCPPKQQSCFECSVSRDDREGRQGLLFQCHRGQWEGDVSMRIEDFFRAMPRIEAICKQAAISQEDTMEENETVEGTRQPQLGIRKRRLTNTDFNV